MTPKFAKMKGLGEDPSAKSRTMQCAPQVKRKEKKKKTKMTDAPLTSSNKLT